MNVGGNRRIRLDPDLHQRIMDSVSADAYHDRFVEAHLEDAAEDLKELRELRRIADAAQKQAELAQAEAADSKKEARFSKIMSVLSLIIAVASFIGQLFS